MIIYQMKIAAKKHSKKFLCWIITRRGATALEKINSKDVNIDRHSLLLI